MFCKNESGAERILRIIIGVGLITFGFWTSGDYWASYTIPAYQIPCWEWSNLISHGCFVERGFIIAIIGIVPITTGLIGWCPIKSMIGLNKKSG